MKNKRLLQRKLSRLYAVVWMVALSLLLPAYTSMAQVTASDSTALVALYNGWSKLVLRCKLVNRACWYMARCNHREQTCY